MTTYDITKDAINDTTPDIYTDWKGALFNNIVNAYHSASHANFIINLDNPEFYFFEGEKRRYAIRTRLITPRLVSEMFELAKEINEQCAREKDAIANLQAKDG